MATMIDIRVARAGAAQSLALLGPFLYLGLVLSRHGSATALMSEVVLSLVAFYAIVIDWSSSTFLARTQRSLLASGAYFSLVAAKLGIAVFLVVVTIIARPVVCAELDLRTTACAFGMILVGVALDPSWVFVGRKQVWVPQAVSACRFLMGAALATCGVSPILGLAAAFPATSLALILLLRHDLRWPRRVSWRLCYAVIRRYRVPTLTECLTAGFTRLDVAAAARVLRPEAALTYAVCRKLVVGLLSVAFASTRLLYLERDRRRIEQLTQSLVAAMAAAFFVGGVAAYATATLVFRVPSGWALASTLALLLFLLPVGYLKNRIQFAFLFRRRQFAFDLALNVGSAVTYGAACAVAFAFAAREANLLSLARLSADAFYVSAALIVFKRDALSS
jgi:hypothetical protein